jgi:hypothetical protein
MGFRATTKLIYWGSNFLMKQRDSMMIFRPAVLLLGLGTLAACTNPDGSQDGRMTGATVGALTGAAVGNIAGGDSRSTLIGATVGAGAGAIAGNAADNRRAAGGY